MRRDAGISHRGTEYTEIEFQDSGRKKIKVNLSVLGVFVVQGFFTAKARRSQRGFLLGLRSSWRTLRPCCEKRGPEIRGRKVGSA